MFLFIDLSAVFLSQNTINPNKDIQLQLTINNFVSQDTFFQCHNMMTLYTDSSTASKCTADMKQLIVTYIRHLGCALHVDQC